MNLSKHFLIVSSLLLTLSVKSQTISHIQQMPMNFNPAFAGDKNQGRLAFYASNSGNYQRRSYNKYLKESQTYALGYDNLYKKIGFGVQLIGRQISNSNPAVIFPLKSFSGGINSYISPKINKTRKNGLKKYTIAPGIGYSYFHSKEVLWETSVRYLDGLWKPSTYLNNIPQQSHRTELGLLYSSETVRAGIGMSYRWLNSSLKQATVYVPDSINGYNYPWLIDSTVSASPTYIHEGSKKVSWREISFSIYLSKRIYLGSAKNFSFMPYGYYLKSRKYNYNGFSNFYNFRNTNLTIGLITQYKKWLLGLQTGGSVNDQLLVGFESKRVSVVASLGGTYISYGNFNTNTSLSINYFFAPKQD
jgi:hypothetical protein